MRVLLVRYIRNADNYFFDLFDAAIAGALRDAGHEARVVERIAAEGFDEEGVLDGLLAHAERFAPDLVLLSYVPSGALSAMLADRTGAKVATYGSRLLLEAPGVDYVLAEPDPLAVLQLVEALGGGRPLESVAALCWREGMEVRRSGLPLHSIFDIFTRCPIDYGAFARLGPGRPPEIRKHIAADWGCVYRNTRPPVPSDPPPGQPSWVPRGGCTFCTRPAWQPLDWDLLEPVLARQLDAVLAAFPDLAKLIVIDEYALSRVDRLAVLLRSRPLDGAEVLLSGRLDHIRRHQEALESALELLREKCTLRLYQFGIENLADSVLARYNKGLTFGQIEESLALVRKLEAAHANLAVEQSFGFILFDPWTTLEELQLNVERAERLGLSRYRGRAPFTSLRLLPEMALYWQAQADGLLTGRVDDNDFGYSVHSGWRFRDDRVAAVHDELLRRRGEREAWSLLAAILSVRKGLT